MDSKVAQPVTSTEGAERIARFPTLVLALRHATLTTEQKMALIRILSS